MALRKAIVLDLIIKNPCEFVELPKHVRKETMSMGQEEASNFLKAAAKDKFGLVFELALITGMRPEEYLGLTWCDATSCQNLDFSKFWHTFGIPKSKKGTNAGALSY